MTKKHMCYFPDKKCKDRMLDGQCWQRFVEGCYEEEETE